MSNRSAVRRSAQAPGTALRRDMMGNVSPAALGPSSFDLMIQTTSASETRVPGVQSRAVDAFPPRIRAIAEKLLDALTVRTRSM